MYTSSITIDDVIDSLREFLVNFVPGDIVRAQTNRVPMPKPPCAILTELLTKDYTVPYETYDLNEDVEEINILCKTRVDVQIDFYGEESGDYCRAVMNTFRSGWAWSRFPENIKPLSTSNGIQSPLITGEHQYGSRWTLTVSLQVNTSVTVPEEFSNEITISTIEAVL